LLSVTQVGGEPAEHGSTRAQNRRRFDDICVAPECVYLFELGGTTGFEPRRIMSELHERNIPSRDILHGGCVRQVQEE
jgi:hypothetical protein